MPTRPLVATLLLSLAALTSQAAGLPNQVRISYDARLAGLPVGDANQHWVQDKGHYRLDTEITPIFGPRIRYQSSGELGDGGLQPADYAEFRGNGATPRQQARFDWPKQQVNFGMGEAAQTAKLEAGAQDLNTLPFQLAWLSGKRTANLQIMTGRKLRQDRFTLSDGPSVQLMGKTTPTRIWRAPDGDEGTEIWLAPELGNLPVKIIRHDDKGELQLVAKSIEYQLE